MTFRIVPMTLEDIPAVMEIERSCHVQPWSESLFVEELQCSQSHAFVACHDNADHRFRVLGYICFWLVVDEVQIFNLAVDIAHRRCGIGRALLHHALLTGYRNRARVAVLEVRRSNDAARQLYTSLGFQQVGERKDYYGGFREPAVIMELEIDRDWCALWGVEGSPNVLGPPVQT